MLLVTLRDQLVMTEQILNGLLFAVKLVFEYLHLRLQLDIIFLNLVIEHLHLDGLLVQLFLLLGLKAVAPGLVLHGAP